MANKIYNLLYELINMTIQANLKLISIASDGAASEYNVQLELMKGHNTNNFLLYKDEIYNINFSAPVYENRLIIRVQDPRHTKKNSRNNVHIGTCLLMLGKDTIRYDQILTLAKDNNSALYMRDVINVDNRITVLHLDFLAQLF